MDKKNLRIGIDLGGTNIKVGIVDNSNNIVSKYSVKTESEKGHQHVITNIINAVNELLSMGNILTSDCVGIGMGSPGIVDAKNGIVVYTNNLKWNNVHICDILGKAFSLPVYVSNDANCAALGESTAGIARNEQNVVLITLGTGVGGGIVVDGKVFEGGGPGNTEIGHIVVEKDGILCTCGRYGCLESYASATGLIASANRAIAKNPDSLLCSLKEKNSGNMNGEIPFIAAERGDETAIKVIDDYIHYLGEGIVNLANIFRPETIVLSGGICAQGEKLTLPLYDFLKKNIYGGEALEVPNVKIASLGNDAGILGAACLCAD